MEEFSARRGAHFFLAFVYAGFAASFLPFLLRWALCAAAALSLGFLALPLPRPRRETRRLCRPFLLGACAGLLLCAVYTDVYIGRTTEAMDGRTCEIEGIVLEAEPSPAYAPAYLVRLRAADGAHRFGVIEITAPGVSLSPGDCIRGVLEGEAFPEMSGAFPSRRYHYGRGILLGGEASGIIVTGRRFPGLSSVFASWREALSASLEAGLGREGAALPAALFLGDRSLLPASLTRDFRRLGAAHLLAISGMHLTLLLGALSRLLRHLGLSKRWRIGLLALADVGYMLLCGMTDPVVRAGGMVLLAALAAALSRTPDTLTSLGAASFVLCVARPSSFYSIALQLSVTAVLGLLGGARILGALREGRLGARLSPRIHALLAAVTSPIWIQGAMMPLIWLAFGETSLLSPLAALLLTPPVAAVLLLTPVYLLLRELPLLSPLLRELLTALGALIRRGAGWMAAPRYAAVSLAAPIAPYLAVSLAAAILWALLARSGRQVRRAALSALCLTVLLPLSSLAWSRIGAENVTVTASVYKSSESLCVQSGGRVLLCDLSDGSYGAASAAYAAAHDAGATEIEVYLLTHLHARHVDSVDRLSDAAYLRTLLLPQPDTESEAAVYDALCALAAEKGIACESYRRSLSDRILFGEAAVTVEAARLARSTHPALAVRVACPGGTLAHLGASWAEARLSPPDGADAVLFGRHGPIVKRPFAADCTAAALVVFRGGTETFYEGGLPPDTRATDETVRIIFRAAADTR